MGPNRVDVRRGIADAVNDVDGHIRAQHRRPFQRQGQILMALLNVRDAYSHGVYELPDTVTPARGTMKIAADPNKCELHGECMVATPEVFTIEDDAEISTIPDSNPPSGHAARRERTLR